jgi:hypothetical protein
MARPRKPTELLEQSGAFDHDPQRRADRENEPVPNGPLGDPPDRLTPLQQKCWHEIAGYVPDGVLTCCDRLLVEKLARLMARERQGESLKAAEHSLMLRCMSLMGMTPSDRSRIKAPTQPKQEAEDTFSRLASSPRGRVSDLKQ